MSAVVPQADRRAKPRFVESTVRVTLRVPGQLGTSSGRLIDYNRHGLAVCLAGSSALITSKTSLVTLSFRIGEFQIRNAQAAIHNRVRIAEGVRLGIRFRIETAAQLDAATVRRTLNALEESLFAEDTQLAGDSLIVASEP